MVFFFFFFFFLRLKILTSLCVLCSKHRNNFLHSRMWTVPLNFLDSNSKQRSLLLHVFEQCMVLDSDVVNCENCRVAGKGRCLICFVDFILKILYLMLLVDMALPSLLRENPLH